jgi:E-phenylitaconyl-CoA hydratase
VTEPVLLVERWDWVTTLTLNRPERRNAINDELRDALVSALTEADADSGTRVVVLTGAGTAFCSGVDLADGAPGGDGAARGEAPGNPPDRPPVAAPFWDFSKPIIAALNGPAVGGGLEIALACDIRICAEEARFGLTELKIGSLPGSAGTQLLPRVVGLGNAARMLFTGDLMDAERARDIGLVSDVVPAAELLTRAKVLAERIAANAPLSVVAAKRALRAALDLPFAEGQALERRLWAELAVTDDRAEGRAAFRDKRAPRFTGR